MNRLYKVAFGALLPCLFAAGCSDFLAGPKLGDDDPNRPTVANREQLLMAVQASQFIQQTGSLARIAAMWTQQMAGTDRQYQTLGTYEHTEDDFTSQFSRVYSGGGLVDMRRIIAEAEADGDRRFAGVAKVWEAFSIGTAASLWGDIPYSEAVSEVETPGLDSQADIYAAVQALLDEAIADLQSGQGSGPGAADLVYGGDAEKWVEAAHTLKARFYLHWAEVDPSNYARALAAAQNGISTSDHDFRTYQSAAAGEQNVWYQFMFRDRDSYIRVGKFLVDLMVDRADPRLSEYFAPNGDGEYVGAEPGEGVKGVHSLLSATRGAPGFRQPLITWAENELIIAEASYQGGDQDNARNRLNAVRAAVGLPEISPSDDALLEEIMTEKYISLFQNIEVWNDYKRTCIPAITPADAGGVPGRLFYGTGERNANPNVPAPSAQPDRNANDPNAC